MSNRLYTMGLAAHVADFHAAFHDTPSKQPRKTLALLQGNPIAQIMSFMPCKEERRCLRAVSPQVRLDSEVITDERRRWRMEPRVRVITASCDVSCAVADGVLCFSFISDSIESNQKQIALSLWWASRCGLPVELSIDNNDSEMLALLGNTLRSRLKRLEISVRDPPVGAAGDASVSNSAPSPTALASLLSFPSLQSLSLWNEAKDVEGMLTMELASALEAAASLPLVALKLYRWKALDDLNALAGHRLLRNLTVSDCRLRSLEGVNRYPMLETLTISNCPHLTSASALKDLPRLHAVEILACNLQSLDGLDRCVALESINVSGSRNLRSLSPLAGAPLLETVVACHCDIRSVQGLGSCVALTEITLRFNHNLQTLGDLSKAPCLRHLRAGQCGLRDLGETGPWSALREIDVNGNHHVQSLSGLAGAPLLEAVHVVDCGVEDFTVLGTCPMLRNVFKTDSDYS